MISGMWLKSNMDKRVSEWGKQMQLFRQTLISARRYTAHTHTHAQSYDSKHSLNPLGITNPLIVGQLVYAVCRSHTDPVAFPHCFMLHIWTWWIPKWKFVVCEARVHKRNTHVHTSLLQCVTAASYSCIGSALRRGLRMFKACQSNILFAWT